MHTQWALIITLGAALVFADEGSDGDIHAPGRSNRMFSKRATDHGTFEVDCAGSEGACNNACYYINCQAHKDPDANKIVYIGLNGNNGEDKHNRVESGCNFNNPSSGSVCTNFPFSQKFSDPTATGWQCDEWPPAVHQQPDPFEKRKYPNSLRCMTAGENDSLGAKIGNFISSKGMSRDDFFRVDFAKKIGSADQGKVKFCLGQGTSMCGQDGFQFGMTAKPVGGGKISSYYNLDNDDNRYSLQNDAYADLFQCGVEFTRAGDKDFKNVKLSNWENSEVQTTNDCSIGNDGETCVLKGLPNDLTIKRTGKLGSKVEFQYAEEKNINRFTWDSETSGDGRGPWTDPDSDPNRKPLRYCKVVEGGSPDIEKTECWFPCYKNADGK